MSFVTPKSIVFGTGFLRSNSDIGSGWFNGIPNKVYCKPKEVIAVRGPLTRQKLLTFGIPCPEQYGDPLILFPAIYPVQQIVTQPIVGILPHYSDVGHPNLRLLTSNLTAAGFQVKSLDIETGNNYTKLLDGINSCQYLISSSLHGMMMGLLYKKRTVYTHFSGSLIGGEFKFDDFFASLSITYTRKNDYTAEVLQNTISVDYDVLVERGLNLIRICPFLSEERKATLMSTYAAFYDASSKVGTI